MKVISDLIIAYNFSLLLSGFPFFLEYKTWKQKTFSCFLGYVCYSTRETFPKHILMISYKI